jgi:cytochrome c peroxidase
VELGRFLFFDPRASGDGSLACASCHDPNTGWADGLPLSPAYPASLYFRNTPTVLNTAYQKRFYWDGRLADLPTLVRDSLTEAHFMNVDGRLLEERWMQIPEYRERFEKAFGGEPSFGRTLDAMAAFVRTLTSRNVPLDRYLAGDRDALSPEGRHGLELFQGKAGCMQCHNGPLLSDGSFHNLGVPDNREIVTDPLRRVTLRRFFKTLGVPAYHTLAVDVGLHAITNRPGDWGKFRTPSLREVARTAPYMHNGMLATLGDVVAFYNAGGGQAPNKDARLKPLGLTDMEQQALVKFLESLSGDPVTVEPPTLPEYQVWKLGR